MPPGKNPCKVCKDRPANVRGGICHVCNETVEGQEFLAKLAEISGGEIPARSRVVLPDDPNETDLQAMDALRLQEGKPRTVRQRSWVRLYRESEKEFLNRMDKEKGRSTEPSAGKSIDGVGWDGVGPCPTCKHQPEQPIEDPSGDQVRALIQRLLAKSREGV